VSSVVVRGPVPWQRSRLHPDAVFVLREVVGVSAVDGKVGCARCVFNAQQTGCSQHICTDGVWVSVVEAAVLRLEE
jgi:hypothetical protein